MNATQPVAPTSPIQDTFVGVWIDHIKAAKIPLLIVGIGTVLIFRVDQIAEVFFLLATTAPFYQQLSAALFALIAGITLWHTTRTIFRFDLPGLIALSNPRGRRIRTWLPRVLAAAVPLLVCVGYVVALLQPSIKQSGSTFTLLLPSIFVFEALFLFGALTARRRIVRKFSATMPSEPDQERRVKHWRELEKLIRWTYLSLIAANVLAVIAAAKLPGLLAKSGTLSVILLVAAFATASGTYLTIQSYRWRFPLLSALFFMAVLWQLIGSNDNHRVRLYPDMNSDAKPDFSKVDMAPAITGSFQSYALKRKEDDAPIYLVSAEGGGIRAAAWTALVLTQLELVSQGEFSHSMLAGSGISGGSLGLSLFDAMLKATAEKRLTQDKYAGVLNSFLETDFLAPVVETMFLTDLVQRFDPFPNFIDRGQHFENAWERAWRKATGCESNAARNASASMQPACSTFSRPWSELWAGEPRPPVLFLNSTIVQSGRRFVQHPFEFIVDDAGQNAEIFKGAVSSAGILPSSAPLSAVTHDSARFTYVNPVGTLMQNPKLGGEPLQLVDGGYFENSGTTTLLEIAQIIASDEPTCAANLGGLSAPGCRIRIIHISNDTGVEPLQKDDACGKTDTPVKAYGEVSAPIIALLNTRDARGENARRAIKAAVSTQHFSHFRLCTGEHALPLGWTLSHEAMMEMIKQLCGGGDKSNSNSKFNQEQITSIAGQRGGKGLCPP